jgi:ankyrin repeat protein
MIGYAGASALHFACDAGNLEVVRLLCVYGALGRGCGLLVTAVVVRVLHADVQGMRTTWDAGGHAQPFADALRSQ